ncbi:MAG: sulfur oxidation c-type cytochrome SoxA [Xanthobacteraceae bacterium]
MRAALGRAVLIPSIASCALVAATIVGLASFAQAQAQTQAQAKRQAPLATKGEAAPSPWKRYPDWNPRDSSKFNTLAKLATPPAPKEIRKLTGPITGDAANGQKLVADRNRGGSCLACHVMGQAGNADLPGDVGPDLSEIGNAGREDEYLFNYVYDARVYNPETVMPPWGTHGLFNEQEIKDIVAFVKTLKTPAKFRSTLDDPRKRPAPVETRDNLDDMLNPGMWTIERAQTLWKANGPSGSSCATCHTDAKLFKTWAAGMPKWEPRVERVLGVEEFVTRHAKATTGAEWLMESSENIAMAVYLRNLANGQEIKVDIASPGAKEAYERGKALAARKVGQLNFACNDCHNPQKGGLKWIRGQWLGEQRGQYDHFPTWRTSLQTVWDIRKRFQWCQVNIRADELPPDAKEYGDLELYLASLNSGLKLSVPGIRH